MGVGSVYKQDLYPASYFSLLAGWKRDLCVYFGLEIWHHTVGLSGKHGAGDRTCPYVGNRHLLLPGLGLTF